MTSDSAAPPARILIIDDHPMVRHGLANLLAHQAGLAVCGEAADAAEAFVRIRQLRPDVALVDLSLGGGSGLELIKQVKREFPSVRMLVFSMQDESIFAQRSLRAGAMGYVSKDEPTERIVEAIHAVLKGEVYCSPQVASCVMQAMIGVAATDRQSSLNSLTDRELEVFSMIGRGMSTREIAQQLQLSVKTIESYREHLKAKLNVPNASELMRHAVQWVLENG